MTMPRRLIRPLTGRDPEEASRTSTPLELLFDLTFVVAIAQVSSELHHGLLSGDIGQTVFRYVFVFGAIWWAWMGFSWFASGFDTDDVFYRVMVFVQMTGALVLAAGVPSAFEENDWVLVLLGYVIMRLAFVVQWLRVARDAPECRPGALRYAAGFAVLQSLWVLLIVWSPAWFFIGFMVLFAFELIVPIWAERASHIPFHPEHIAERYGLFTIIVLGETILSASLAVTALTMEGLTAELVGILLGGLLTVFVMWWFYFYEPIHDLLKTRQTVFAWGYGHLPIWAAAAAVGAGLAVAIEQAAGLEVALNAVAAGYAVSIPVAVYVAGSWGLHGLPRMEGWTDAAPVVAAIVGLLIVPLTGWGVPLCGLVLVSLLGFKLVRRWVGENAAVMVRADD
jgi:low temperature requirement protein LtrA